MCSSVNSSDRLSGVRNSSDTVTPPSVGSATSTIATPTVLPAQLILLLTVAPRLRSHFPAAVHPCEERVLWLIVPANVSQRRAPTRERYRRETLKRSATDSSGRSERVAGVGAKPRHIPLRGRSTAVAPFLKARPSG